MILVRLAAERRAGAGDLEIVPGVEQRVARVPQVEERADRLARRIAGRVRVARTADVPALAGAALAARVAEARVEDPDRPGATRDLDRVVVEAVGVVAG